MINYLKAFYFELRILFFVFMWEMNGKTMPPPHEVNQKCISDYKNKFNINILVEPGTFRGSMIERQLHNFKTINSIEIFEPLYLNASEKFKSEPKVILKCGDSSDKLEDILNNIDEPVIFCLDGHYSGENTGKGSTDCAVNKELEVIFNHKIKSHLILIDDARLFNGTNDYSTIEEIKSKFEIFDKRYNVIVKDDVIQCYI